MSHISQFAENIIFNVILLQISLKFNANHAIKKYLPYKFKEHHAI